MAEYKYRVINHALLGLNAEERKTGYQLHPLIRNNWKSIDKLKEAMAYGGALYTRGGEMYVNWKVADSASYFAQPGGPFLDPSSLVFGSGGPSWFNFLDTGNLVPQDGQFNLEFDIDSWNSLLDPYTPEAARGRVDNLLYEDMMGTPYSGIPYFIKYFANSTENPTAGGLDPSDLRMQGAVEAVPQLMEGLINTDIYDHTFEYTVGINPGPDSNIDIEPTYNFFLDTSPDYETAISDLPESMIPNYYVLEVNSSLTGSTPYQTEAVLFQNQIQAAQASAFEDSLQYMFDGEPSPLVPESQSGYYPYYLGLLKSVEEADVLQNTKDEFTSKAKNIAVLSAEVSDGFLEGYNNKISHDQGSIDTSDDVMAIDNYPFYNKIIIPNNKQYRSNPADGIFNALTTGLPDDYQAREVLLTYMQLFVIHYYVHGNPGGVNFDNSFTTAVKDRTGGSPGDTDTDPNYADDVAISTNSEIPMLIHLEDFLQAIDGGGANSPDLYALAEKLVNQYDGGGGYGDGLGAAELNTIILREGTDTTDSLYTAPEGTATLINADYGMASAAAEAFAQKIYANLRRFEEVIRGPDPPVLDSLGNTGPRPEPDPSPSEAIMYIVEKRVIPPGQTVPIRAPVQTFFFGRDVRSLNFAARKGIVYYDTQIKYGVRYQYDIKQVRVVIGNRYQYHTAQTIVNNDDRKQGRAIGNALGFFAPERSELTLTHAYQDMQNGEMSTRAGSPLVGGVWPAPGTAYLPEDGELSPTDMNLYNPPDPLHFGKNTNGYYIYRWAPGPMVGTIETNEEAFNSGVFTNLNPATPAVDRYNVDYSLIKLKVKVGSGFDGYESGGLIAFRTMTAGSQSKSDPGAEFGEVAYNILPPQPPSSSMLVYQLTQLREIFTAGEFDDPNSPGQIAWLQWHPSGAELQELQDAIDTYNSSTGFRSMGRKDRLVDAMEDLGMDVSWYTHSFATLGGKG